MDILQILIQLITLPLFIYQSGNELIKPICWKPREARIKQREARHVTKEARGSPAQTIGEQ